MLTQAAVPTPGRQNRWSGSLPALVLGLDPSRPARSAGKRSRRASRRIRSTRPSSWRPAVRRRKPVMRRLDALERGQEELEAGLLMLAHEVGARRARHRLSSADRGASTGSRSRGSALSCPACDNPALSQRWKAKRSWRSRLSVPSMLAAAIRSGSRSRLRMGIGGSGADVARIIGGAPLRTHLAPLTCAIRARGFVDHVESAC